MLQMKKGSNMAVKQHVLNGEQVAAASVKTETTDYMKPSRPALYTEKITVPTEVMLGGSVV